MFMYYLVQGVVWLLSLLPLRVLYGISDIVRFFAYYVIRYRRKVVHDNLTGSFPEKSEEEIRRIEKEFYSFFCDYLVETIKLCSISNEELNRRMQFKGVKEMVEDLKREDKLFGFIYLAHYGNWEWVSSLSARIHEVDPAVTGGHVYHPLRNAAVNRLFLHLRGRFEGVSVAMKETLRFVLLQKRKQQRTFIGFIADQNPKWNSIHHWTTFMNRKTPVFIGTERIAKQVNALVYYGYVERVRRGYYCCTLTRMVQDVKQYKDFEVTDMYFHMLENSIKEHPSIWLWTHKRWKRTYEEYVKRAEQKQ